MKKNNYSIFVLLMIALVSSCKYQIKDDEDPKPQKDPILKLLTGNNDAGKTWRICADPYQTKVYPSSYLANPDVSSYWEFVYGLIYPADVDGWLKNSFTFSSKNNQFIPKNQFVRGHWGYLNAFWATQLQAFDDTAVVDPNCKQTSFELKNEKNGIGTGYTLEISNNGHLGYLSNRQSKYYIMSLNKDTMRVAHLFTEYQIVDGRTVEYGTTAWQSTLVAK